MDPKPPAAPAFALFTLAARSRRGSVRGLFAGGRGSSRRWLRYSSSFGGGGTHANNRGFVRGSLGGWPVRRGSVALLTGTAVAIPTSVSAPIAIPFPVTHRALVAGDLVEIVVLFEEVRNVEKRVALESYIDESRLHSGQDARDAPLMNTAGERIFVGALEVDFHQLVVFDQCHFGLMPIG